MIIINSLCIFDKLLIIMNNFKRPIYLNKVEPYINKNLIKVIVGQRRIGKSYFLNQVANKIKREVKNATIIFINKELLEFDAIKDYKDLVVFAEEKKGKAKFAYIFIDEVQEILNFEKALRHFQAKQCWDIYCTGSNADLLSGELSTYLSGRYIEIKMYGLSYNEFLYFHNFKESQKAFSSYLKFGGLPYLYHLELNETVIYDYLKNVYAAILFKDVVARYKIRNVSFLERLTLFIADNIGQVVSAGNISKFLKSQKIQFSNNIVLDYIDYLCNAYFIFKVRRNDLKGKKILEIGEKYYFGDTGLRHALTGYKTNDISQLLENIVFIHLQINNYQITIGKLATKEIDFVCEKNGTRIYIQVTLSLNSEEVLQREFGNLTAIKDNFRKIVITADEITNDNRNGIEIWNIRKFLLLFK